ncbi:MAG: hypothetical protein QXU75_06465 [Candidatus Methanomethylicaceae archaeon]
MSEYVDYKLCQQRYEEVTRYLSKLEDCVKELIDAVNSMREYIARLDQKQLNHNEFKEKQDKKMLKWITIAVGITGIVANIDRILSFISRW